MVTIVPSFDWYAAKSKAAGLPPRCPIAQAELCPRYYSSLWLLADVGITTEISDNEKERLDRKWEPFRPTIREEEPSIVHIGHEFRGFGGFCPEVGYEIFHHFVSALHRYADEIDSGLMHKQLAREGASPSDPRWSWSIATPRHYTECREFSIFSKADLGFGSRPKSGRRPRRQGLSARLRWQVLTRDSFTCQYCGRRPPDVVLEADHKVAVADGGKDDIENLIAACLDCNRGKGASSTEKPE